MRRLSSSFCMPHLVKIDVAAVKNGEKEVEYVQFAIKNKTNPTDSKIDVKLLYVFCMDVMGQNMINIDNGVLPYLLPSSKCICSRSFFFLC